MDLWARSAVVHTRSTTTTRATGRMLESRNSIIMFKIAISLDLRASYSPAKMRKLRINNCWPTYHLQLWAISRVYEDASRTRNRCRSDHFLYGTAALRGGELSIALLSVLYFGGDLSLALFGFGLHTELGVIPPGLFYFLLCIAGESERGHADVYWARLIFWSHAEREARCECWAHTHLWSPYIQIRASSLRSSGQMTTTKIRRRNNLEATGLPFWIYFSLNQFSVR